MLAVRSPERYTCNWLFNPGQATSSDFHYIFPIVYIFLHCQNYYT